MIGRWRTVPPAQVCAVLSIGRWDLAQLVCNGDLPARVTERALERYIARHLPARQEANR